VRHSSLTLVKVGGGLCARAGALPRVGAAVARAARKGRLVVLPGGGPFADAVRGFDADHGLTPTAAHWMAILAMDQYAFALADQVPGSRLVEDMAGIQSAHADRAVPVLAPYRWLRAADELPHSWEITSDTLAAYLGTLLGADHLVLVKPVAGGSELVDPRFERTLPAGLAWTILGVAEIDRLEAVIGELAG
jgi:5-(aminomethyl)-3-furanmethanol phosphate kinase